MLRRLVSWITLVVLLAPAVARADEAAARAHFRKGIALYDKKQYVEALVAFQDAYREKPSAGIKQNIALTLKGLHRPADAATAFDEALDEGKDALKPETRAAIEQELAELTKVVATVKLVAVGDDKHPIDSAVFAIATPGTKPQPLPSGVQRRPLRLMPGLYTFTAHAEGYADPPEKRLALVSGTPIDATFVLGGGATALAMLSVQANVAEASIRIDGVEVAHGTYSGKVAAGARKIEVSASGYKTASVELVVGAGETVAHPVTLQPVGSAPSEYVAPAAKPVKWKRLYVGMTGALDVTSYRLAPPLGEPAPNGTRRRFGGLSVGGRFGYMMTRFLSIEGVVEIGGQTAKYSLRPTDRAESKTDIAHWHIAPQLRLTTPGKVRFTAATGLGVHGLSVETTLEDPTGPRTKRGKGAGLVWLLDAGVQFDAGPVFFEGALFLAVHGVTGPEDDAPPGDRLLLASPAVRGGLRLGLGIPF